MWKIYVIFFILCISCNYEGRRDMSNLPVEECDTIQISNLHLLCKVWGFMKYYHPDIANGMYDWDNELFEIMPRVVNIKSKKERNRVLSKWINKYDIPTSCNKSLSDTQMPNVKTYPDISWIENKEELGEVSDLLLNLYKDYCYLEF